MVRRTRRKRRPPRFSIPSVREYTMTGALKEGAKADISPNMFGISTSGLMVRATVQIAPLYIATEAGKVVTATTAPVLFQISYYEVSKSNSLIATQTRISSGATTFRYRWPRRIDDFAASEVSQSCIVIETPTVLTDYNISAPFLVKIWVRQPVISLPLRNFWNFTPDGAKRLTCTDAAQDLESMAI